MNLNYKEESQHLLSHPVNGPTTARPPAISLAREGLKKEQAKFSKAQTKQGCKTAGKKQMMFCTGKNVTESRDPTWYFF